MRKYRVELVALALWFGCGGEEASKPALSPDAGVCVPSASEFASVRPLFVEYCSACHGASGAGNPLLGAPALNDQVWLYGGSRDAVHNSIANGRTGVMPSFAQRLDAAQIKMVAAWIAERSGAPAVASN